MPRCIVRYRATIVPRRTPWVAEGESIVRMEEWRDADEWGDPGRIRRRRLLTVEGEVRSGWMDRLNTATPFWELLLIARIGPVRWAESADMGENMGGESA